MISYDPTGNIRRDELVSAPDLRRLPGNNTQSGAAQAANSWSLKVSRRCDQVLQTQARARHEDEKREPRQMVLMPWQSFFVCPELMDFPVVELITAVSLRDRLAVRLLKKSQHLLTRSDSFKKQVEP